MPEKDFFPFGELLPDRREFVNRDLLKAVGVVPVNGNYVAAQIWDEGGDEPTTEPYGLHVHFAGGSTWYGYLGTVDKLYEVSSALTLTDKTRLVGGAYASGGAGGEAGWQAVSFGDSVIKTNYIDDVQYLPSPASANFEKLIQSGGGNPGMSPKAAFVFSVRNNVFLANLNLSAPFDGLAAGANPTAVAWSQSDVPRQFGSFNATPELIGAGYQPLNYDIGHINGGIGGDFGIVSLQRGWVRIDGPPYTFRPFAINRPCRFPNSICVLGGDVYFWGSAGPSVIRSGFGEPEVLGEGKVARTLIDNSTGFSGEFAIYNNIPIRHVSVGVDSVNGLIYWSITTQLWNVSRVGDLSVVYNTNDGRFSFVDNHVANLNPAFDPALFYPGIIFLRSIPDLGSSWSPGRDLIGVMRYQDIAAGLHYQLARPSYVPLTPPAIWSGATPTFTTGFQQLDPGRTTRITRVRLVYSKSAAATETVAVTIASKNRPFDTATELTYTTTDTHGWITTPTTTFADFHQVKFVVSGSGVEAVSEFKGFELEWELGGQYAA